MSERGFYFLFFLVMGVLYRIGWFTNGVGFGLVFVLYSDLVLLPGACAFFSLYYGSRWVGFYFYSFFISITKRQYLRHIRSSSLKFEE